MLLRGLTWLRSRWHILRWSYIARDARVKEIVQCLRQRKFDFVGFELLLGYNPRYIPVLFQAIVHRSYLQFLTEDHESNERLEFLGDAVLNFIVAEQLYEMFPEMEEGYLTKLRSRLVNRRMLAQQARAIKLSQYLLLSTSAAHSIDTGSDSILADAFEALIGAMYLDGGIRVVREFVKRHILTLIEQVLTDNNYKSALLEYAQAHDLGIPHYTVTKEEGPEHDRRFTVEVYLGTEPYGTGNGRSKKEAEQLAAAHALDKLLHNQKGKLLERRNEHHEVAE